MSRPTTTALATGSWEQVEEAVWRQVIDGSSMTCSRYRFAPGASFPEHRHVQEQVTYVISGHITFSLPDGEETVGPDGLLIVPANVPHGGRAGSEGAELLCIVSPARRGPDAIQFVGHWSPDRRLA